MSCWLSTWKVQIHLFGCCIKARFYLNEIGRIDDINRCLTASYFLLTDVDLLEHVLLSLHAPRLVRQIEIKVLIMFIT